MSLEAMINIFKKRIVVWLLLLLPALTVGYAIYVFFTLPDVTFLRSENPKRTALMQLRIDDAQSQGKKLKIQQSWVSLSKVPELFRQMVRITEDAAFYSHEGIDFDELKESIKKNWEKGKFARGGSTITQQLAKNLFLSTEKSFHRKIKEYFIARRLEKELSKDRIFYLYLNVIEFGRGIFGVQAAAQRYFNCDVSALSNEQMVRLTAIIPRPLSADPTASGRWIKWKSRWIVSKLRQHDYISEEEHDALLLAFR